MSSADRLTEVAFASGWQLVRRVPEPWAMRGFDLASREIWNRQGPAVRQLRANLARVIAVEGRVDSTQLEDTTREGVRRYLRYWQEAFRLPAWSDARVSQTFQLVEGLELLDEAMATGRGAVMAMPHMGNWDHAAAWATLRYGGLTTVAERLKPEGLYDRFVAYRESLGMEVLPLGGTDVVRTLSQRLRSGGLVALLADRDIRETGVPVQFFGEEATMPSGPAVLALLAGSPLHPVTCWHTDAGTQAIVHPRIEVPDGGTRSERAAIMTQGLANAFEKSIRQHPADWHMMQSLWRADIRSVSRRNARVED
jgi:phosphatidylinositol dimannoside acyltransferase